MEGGLPGLADGTHARRGRSGRVPAEIERRLAAALFARSARKYAERVPDPENPLYWERCEVIRDGSLTFHGLQLHLSQALAGEAVGSVEVELW